MSGLLDMLNAYQSFTEKEDEKHTKNFAKGVSMYRLFNPYNDALNNLLIALPSVVIISEYRDFFRLYQGSIEYSDHFVRARNISCKRQDPSIFTEICFCAMNQQANAVKRAALGYIVASCLKNYPDTKNSSNLHNILRDLFRHSDFRTADFHPLLEKLAENNDRTTSRLLLSLVDLDTFSEFTQGDSIIEKGGDDFFLFLIECGLAPALLFFDECAVTRLFGDMNKLPSSLPKKYASALPMVISALLEYDYLNDISPLDLINSLPFWQQPYVTERLLQDMC